MYQNHYNDFDLVAESKSLVEESFSIDLTKYSELKIILSYYNNILSSAIIDYNWLYMHQNGSVQLYGSTGKGYYAICICRFLINMSEFNLKINHDTDNWADNSLLVNVYGKKK